jgi:hypothetical protein
LTESVSLRSSIDNAHYSSKKSWLNVSVNASTVRDKREKDNIEISTRHLPLIKTTPARYPFTNL